MNIFDLGIKNPMDLYSVGEFVGRKDKGGKYKVLSKNYKDNTYELQAYGKRRVLSNTPIHEKMENIQELKNKFRANFWEK